MSEAPERIWANPDRWIEHPPKPTYFRPYEYNEYIRADMVAALVEALRVIAASESVSYRWDPEKEEIGDPMLPESVAISRAALAAWEAANG